MPKQTFFNLPEGKRQTIERAALAEFAAHGFDASNMNRIVENSKIAKGSFYQYFADKKDLYFHLLDTMVTRKMEAVAPYLDGIQQKSFSENVENLFRAGLAFADSDPKYYLLGEDFAGRQSSFYKEFVAKYQPMSLDIYGQLLANAKDKDELQEGLNLPLVSSFIIALINQTAAELIAHAATKEQRELVITELISFLGRAILKTE